MINSDLEKRNTLKMFTVSGGLLLISIYLKNDRFIGVFLKSFVFLAFLRSHLLRWQCSYTKS